MSIKCIDLFSGCGGTTAGLKMAGIDVVSAVEIDKVASKTFHFNNPEIKLLVDDIRNISANDVLEDVDIDLESDRILLVACPPCQGFSTIRQGGADDERNELVFEYLRLILEINPEYILMENVAGMSRGKGKKIFSSFCDKLRQKYEINFNILNAADYGVPQIRKRLVLHGVRSDVYDKLKINNLTVELPKRTHSKTGEEDGTDKWVNSDIIMDLPKLNAGEEFKDPNKKIFNHTSNGLSELNIQRIKYIKEHGGNRDCLPEELKKNWHRDLRTHKDVYGILDIARPAITITGGCMQFSKGRFGHPRDNRALSAREAARLQSFDDEYRFFGSREQIAKQIGNAVPVKLAQASGKYFSDIDKIIN
ncbi:DNA cytosine methyltransferase [Liquorilactobacillus satsumensis]|uniref:DNA cytosine methyltransferase n=1 Tax=Liquorilactobacillus satsumensis TaxID=259059 RepID=UPI0039EACC21